MQEVTDSQSGQVLQYICKFRQSEQILALMLLSPVIYDSLQKFINGDFSTSFENFNGKMQLKQGDSIIDVGCGTGLISKQYTDRNITYTGIDSSEERIIRARQLNPKANFIVGDLRDPEILKKVKIENVIVHGVLHHLSDQEVTDFYNFLKPLGCHFVGTMDPIRPENKITKPIATLLCDMDEGQFVRKKSQYENLISSNSIESSFSTHKTYKWPVEIFYSVSRLN